ncbi:MerR family transcriptional regulator [Sphingomonas sp. PAMC26645]|nr:MerR family transcriptional regulator [Sphingomonas sp. PAMC26645]
MTIIERVFDFDEKQAARILGIAPRTLRAWRVAGRIGHTRTPTGRVRYSTDQLLAVERSGRVAAKLGMEGSGRAA